MGFWSSLGKGLAIGAGVGLGLGVGAGVGEALFGFNRLFAGGCNDFCGYNARQFDRMDAYLQGRYDQARLDRGQLQLAAMYYGAHPWGCF
jgi:hypothetical protein